MSFYDEMAVFAVIGMVVGVGGILAVYFLWRYGSLSTADYNGSTEILTSLTALCLVTVIAYGLYNMVLGMVGW